MRMTAKFLRKDRPTLTCMVQARTGERILELIEKVWTAVRTLSVFSLSSLNLSTEQGIG